jgi:aminoglycoside phosphotransferase (APT) family kinase protein
MSSVPPEGRLPAIGKADLTAEQLAGLGRHLVSTGALDSHRPMTARRLTGVRSNLTYVLSDGSSEWILRTPPRLGVTPSAHDMSREFRILTDLYGGPVPVPRPISLGDAGPPLGVPFLVMEKVAGPIWRAPEDAVSISAAAKRRACESLVDTLAALHNLPVAPHQNREPYLQRQLDRWDAQWSRWRTRELPAMNQLTKALRERIPAKHGLGRVHGDYRFDNVVLDPERGPCVRAVLDWELSTIGDPLADVGSLVAFWGRPGVHAVLQHQELTRLPGFLTASEVVERYARQTGCQLDLLPVYVAFGCFRWAVIRQGVVARGRLNQADSEELEWIERSVTEIVDRALAVIDGGEPL